MSTHSAASQSHRLAPRDSEVIDRSVTVPFTWNGKSHTGYRGDSVVSALAAAGERVFSRSYKYHKPRGVLAAGYHDPGCVMQIDDEPNVRGAHRLVQPGIRATSQNTWPSLKFDLKGINRFGGRFLVPGFYYKTFMKPQALWPTYERVLRQFIHAGTVDPGTEHEYYDKRYMHPDVLIAGGGPAGMASAISAARAGAQVLLVEEEHQLGGHLRWADPAAVEELIGQVAQWQNIEVLTNSTVLARYDQNWCTVVQRSPSPEIPERLIKARARSLVVASGLIERPYVFAGNDLPGVMLSTAARKLINLYGVRPGERAVVVTANSEGDAAIADLEEAGVEIAHVVDSRAGEDINRALGRSGVRSVELDNGKRVPADLLVTATGWTAPTSLLNMSGDKPVYSPRAARFLPGGQADSGVYSVGGLAGDGTVEELCEHADHIGLQAAQHGLSERARLISRIPTTSSAPDAAQSAPGERQGPMPELQVTEHPELFRASTHGIVDFSEDVSSKDLHLAVAEGYDSAELAKRYTTATMGPTQGKLEAVNAIASIAEATGKSIAETGTTTWRPMYVPVTLGALAGRNFEPVRYSSIHSWHEANGAVPLVAGQWIRPEHYGDPQAEAQAVRESVGIIDVTPIGKLDLQGKDVSKLLNHLYINKWSALEVGRVRYGVMCTEDGVVFDDGVTGRLGENHYLMSTTTSGAAGVWEWVENWLQTEFPEWDVHVTPVTTAYASINVAGPQARRLVSRLTEGVDLSADQFKYMRVRTGTIAGVPDCIIWRIGFTGELSYELHVPAGYGLHVWESLLEAGEDLGVAPFGVEAQRILRLEKGHLIVGQDTDGLTKAYSAGLDWAVKLDKEDFVGKPALADQHATGAGLRLVAIQPDDPEVVPEEASQILQQDGSIGGRITSSRYSPTLSRSVCLGQVEAHLSRPGTGLDVRLPDGRTVRATVQEKMAHLDPSGSRLENHSSPEPRTEHPEPVARGPVPVQGPEERYGDWLVRPQSGAAPLSLTDLTALSKTSIRASEASGVVEVMGVEFGRTTRSADGPLIVGSGPDEWLIIGSAGAESQVLAEAGRRAEDKGERLTVVDMTHGRALFRLTGEDTAGLLSKICAIDFSDDIIPHGAAFRSSVAKVVTDIIRDDLAGSPSYLLHCERSVGGFLYEAIRDAGAEYGIAEGSILSLERP